MLRKSYINVWVVRVGQSVYYMTNVSENKTHYALLREIAQVKGKAIVVTGFGCGTAVRLSDYLLMGC